MTFHHLHLVPSPVDELTSHHGHGGEFAQLSLSHVTSGQGAPQEHPGALLSGDCDHGFINASEPMEQCARICSQLLSKFRDTDTDVLLPSEVCDGQPQSQRHERSKSKSTVGILFSGTTIDGLVEGGPAFNTGLLHRGDMVVKVNRKCVTGKHSLHTALAEGDDAPGAPVVLTVCSALDGAHKVHTTLAHALTHARKRRARTHARANTPARPHKRPHKRLVVVVNPMAEKGIEVHRARADPHPHAHSQHTFACTRTRLHAHHTRAPQTSIVPIRRRSSN